MAAGDGRWWWRWQHGRIHDQAAVCVWKVLGIEHTGSKSRAVMYEGPNVKSPRATNGSGNPFHGIHGVKVLGRFWIVLEGKRKQTRKESVVE